MNLKKGKAKVRTLFTKALGLLKGKDWTLSEIDKMIKEIENCNRKIEQFNRHPDSTKVAANLVQDISYQKRLTEECCWIFTKSMGPWIIGMLVASLPFVPNAGKIVSMIVGCFASLVSSSTYNSKMGDKKDKNGNITRLSGLLEDENNKALKWLREERKRLVSKR